MSYKTLLVLLDSSHDSITRLDSACNLAANFGAHLSALAMTQRVVPVVAAGIGAATAVMDVGQQEEARKEAQLLAVEADKHLAARSQLGDVRWSSQELFVLREVAAIHGRQSDLIIAGPPSDDRNTHIREAAFEGALFSSGRPVLLLPSNWQGTPNLENILVAWDASREAARALSDAAPLIEKAKSITVAVVDPEPGHQGFGDNPGNDIATVLSRHCNKVELDTIPNGGSGVAQALQTKAADIAADLIVMGGYGHSRLRDSLFGGVTRDMVQSSRVPVLISH